MSDDPGTTKSIDPQDPTPHQVVSTAKLVVTFSAAIAATFVATVLQQGKPNCWDYLSVGLMGLTLLVTFVVVVLRPRPSESTASLAHKLMVVQVALSALSSAAAAVGLLSASCGR